MIEHQWFYDLISWMIDKKSKCNFIKSKRIISFGRKRLKRNKKTHNLYFRKTKKNKLWIQIIFHSHWNTKGMLNHPIILRWQYQNIFLVLCKFIKYLFTDTQEYDSFWKWWNHKVKTINVRIIPENCRIGQLK